MENKPMVGEFAAIILPVILTAGVFFYIGGDLSEKRWKSEAIEAGAAYYDCTQDTGKCEFTWTARPIDR